jgi:hypothetical protein
MRAAARSGTRDRSARLVRAWVTLYTTGLPWAIREDRRQEVASDLAEETMDAVRHGVARDLGRARVRRWLLGVPADIVWRIREAPLYARSATAPRLWVPTSRWSFALLAVVAIGTVGGLVLVGLPLLGGSLGTTTWAGNGPVLFCLAASGIVLGIPIAVPRPGLGAGITGLAAAIGWITTPALWGCWAMAVVAVAVRAYEASDRRPVR